VASFTATVDSVADVSATPAEIWKVITDPDLLRELTPLLNRIDAHGDLWTWHMIKIGGLGTSISPSFTEKMTFTEPTLMTYTHQPPAGEHERAGAEGRYELTEIDGGTHLAITLAVTVELPLPERAAPAVRKIMKRTMDRTGDKFSANLLRHLNAHEL
jgi:carbon monoxide dehydrogenase subunit G